MDRCFVKNVNRLGHLTVNRYMNQYVINEYKKLYSGLIADVLKYDIDYQKKFSLNYKPLKSYSEPLVGWAFTSKGGNVKRTLHPEIELDMFKSVFPNAVHVIDVNTKKDVACYGEMTATFVKRFGGVGCISNGLVRDRRYLNDITNFQIYSKGLTVNSAYTEWEIKSYQHKIYLKDDYGKVEVNPNDLIFADNDGIVVIPFKKIDIVLLYSRMRLKNEENIRYKLNKAPLKDIIKFKQDGAIW
jgi:4-hydroxy-4-methyl-2-oxoglutarate aldolase